MSESRHFPSRRHSLFLVQHQYLFIFLFSLERKPMYVFVSEVSNLTVAFFCQAQLRLQLQLQFEADLALFSFYPPPTHYPVVVFPHYGSSSLGRCDDYKNLSASLHVCSRESAAAIVQMQTKPDSMLLRSYVVSWAEVLGSFPIKRQLCSGVITRHTQDFTDFCSMTRA